VAWILIVDGIALGRVGVAGGSMDKGDSRGIFVRAETESVAPSTIMVAASPRVFAIAVAALAGVDAELLRHAWRDEVHAFAVAAAAPLPDLFRALA
jgi:hypothetical protein